MATALLVAGSTLTFYIPPFASTSPYSSVVERFKALGCSNNCIWLTCGSFQLMHMSRDDHAVQFNWSVRASHGGQNEDKTLLQHSQGQLPQGWVSTRKHQCTTAITTMWTESFWAFPESYTTGSCARATADNWETKWLITLPPRWFSAQLLYVCVTAW